MDLISRNQFGPLGNNGNLKQGSGSQDTKSEIVFFFLHLTRNLRFQKENGDLVEE